MSTLVQRFERNTRGRDLIVGDIHGHVTKLMGELQAIGFDPAAGDRLFSVGDLVDRGPESLAAVELLDNPWFHAVQGNHEDMAVRWPIGNMQPGNYRANGGGWNIDNPREVQVRIALRLAQLPVAIELDTEAGPIGIVHAECPLPSWPAFMDALVSPRVSKGMLRHILEGAQWSRQRCDTGDDSLVGGVRAVVVGHTPMKAFTSLGNVLFVDTGGWLGRPFTLLNARTLMPERAGAANDPLRWQEA